MRMIGIFIIACLTCSSLANAKNTSKKAKNKNELKVDHAKWFSDVGIGFRSGAALHETAQGRDFSNHFAFGGEILGQVFGYKHHRSLVTIGYLYAMHDVQGGTAKVRVDTAQKNRFDLALNYEFKRKLLVAGARVGGTMTIISTKISQRDISPSVVGDNLYFEDHGEIDSRQATGVDFGLLGGVGVGLALGHLFDQKNLLEVRLHSDYVRRGERDEITIWGMVVFWPLGF